jgi:hypothetical protein
MEELLRLEIAELRVEVAELRRALERLSVLFDVAAKVMALEEDGPWSDPANTPQPHQIRPLDRRRRPE